MKKEKCRTCPGEGAAHPIEGYAQKRTAAKRPKTSSSAARKTPSRPSAAHGASFSARVGAPPRRELYPPIEPFKHGFLRVSDVHELYYEECGNPAGKPAVFLHGGPGAGSDRRARQLFDPHHYRIVVFDQRGCGRSRPSASLVENTTWHLASAMPALSGGDHHQGKAPSSKAIFTTIRCWTCPRSPRFKFTLFQGEKIRPTASASPERRAIAPAVANAIFAATGKRLRRLPVRPEEWQNRVSEFYSLAFTAQL